jgi:uncharacterized membrane protein YhiD involved in acid resistance
MKNLIAIAIVYTQHILLTVKVFKNLKRVLKRTMAEKSYWDVVTMIRDWVSQIEGNTA